MEAFDWQQAVSQAVRLGARLGTFLEEKLAEPQMKGQILQMKDMLRGLRQIRDLKNQPDYTSFLCSCGMPLDQASFFGISLVAIAKVELKRKQAKRFAVSYLRSVAKSKSIRKTQRLTQIFNDSLTIRGALDAIKKAGSGASLNDHTLTCLLEHAARGEPQSCEGLRSYAKSVLPHLPNMQGRPASLATVTHRLILNYRRGEGLPFLYGYSEWDKDFTDPATMATRRAFAENDFDPRPAARNLRTAQQYEDTGPPGRKSRRKRVIMIPIVDGKTKAEDEEFDHDCRVFLDRLQANIAAGRHPFKALFDSA